MNVAIIIGATRQGRQTPKQAKWVEKAVTGLEDTQYEVVDLADYPLAIFNEPVSPRYNPAYEPSADVQKWLDKLETFDAYIFVTPEYNHSMPAVLKNAMEYVNWQLLHKPATVVSHGSAGGARAEVALKELVNESRAVVLPSQPGLAMTNMSELLSDEGELLDEALRDNPYGPQAMLAAQLAELKWYSDALTTARS